MSKIATASEQAMIAARAYMGERITLSLYVSDKEKEGLQAMSYDPDRLICIEWFNDETMFLQLQVAGPTCMSRENGGGRPHSNSPVVPNGLSIYEREATRLWADIKK